MKSRRSSRNKRHATKRDAQRLFHRRLIEQLEPRLMLAADLSYPDTELAHDFAVRVAANSALPVVQLINTSTSALVSSVSLNGPADNVVNIHRASTTGADLHGDTVRVDLPSFNWLNSYVATAGGVFTVNFEGGLDIPAGLPLPLADDALRVEGSGTYTLGFSLLVLSTSDIAIAPGAATLTGDFTAKSLATNSGKTDATDPTKFLSLPHTAINMAGGSLKAANVTLEATSTVNVTIDRTTALGSALSFGQAGSQLLSTGAITVGATNSLNPQTLAAGGGFNASSSAVIGGSVALRTLTTHTDAVINGSADAAGAMSITSKTTINPTIIDLPAPLADPSATSVAVAGSASTGGVGVAGAVVINVDTLNTTATIGSGAAINHWFP